MPRPRAPLCDPYGAPRVRRPSERISMKAAVPFPGGRRNVYRLGVT